MKLKILSLIKKINFFFNNPLSLSQNYTSLLDFEKNFIKKKIFYKEEIYKILKNLNEYFFYDKKKYLVYKNFFCQNLNKIISKYNEIDLIQIYQVFLFFGEYEIAHKIKNIFLNKKIKVHKFYKIFFLKKINNLKNLEKSNNYFLSQLLNVTKKDENFFILKKKLFNKSVAIIGKSIGKIPKNLNNFDYTLEFDNSFIKKNLKKFPKNIVTINDQSLNKKSLSISVKRSDLIFLKKKIKHKEKLNKIFFINNKDFEYFGSNTALIQNVIFLLNLGVRKITIFNTTLYLPKNGSIYSSNYKLEKKNILQFFLHDPLWMFVVINKLYKLKKIDGDKKFKTIMKLSCKDYARQIENFHGFYWKKRIFNLIKNN